MTDKLKCPFCQRELIREGMNHWWCSCNIEHQGKELYGTTALWQALIQAKQDLEITRKALKEIKRTLDECFSSDKSGFTVFWDVIARQVYSVITDSTKQEK